MRLPKIKEQKRRIILFFIPRIAWILIWLIYIFSRNKFHIDKNISKENAIFAAWHGELLMLPFLYCKIRKKPHIFIIASEHFDAELIVRICALFGFQSIRGSSSKGGRRVLIQSFSKLKDGYDLAIMPDGPRGPYHSVASGIVAMAQKTKSPIVVLQVKPKRFWELNSWDKFRIPKPFSTIEYYALSPFRVDSTLDFEEARNLIFTKMTD